MATKSKLAEGQTVKTVNTEKEQSSVEGNKFSVTKKGERWTKDESGKKVSAGIFEASSSRQILTEDAIVAMETAMENVDGFSLREIALVFNQVQREDAINSCNSEIAGASSADPEAKKIRGLARTIEAFIEDGNAVMVKALIKGAKTGDKLDILERVLGPEKYAAALAM
jgi:hypothetical protein